jgi:hypothetical protein
MTVKEKRISAEALMANLLCVIEEIAQHKTVFIVELCEPTDEGVRAFVLGPESLCGSVCGLFDVEYGWPVDVDAEKVDDLQELAPSHHKHPYLRWGSKWGRKCMAVGIHLGEYEEIKRRIS